MTVQSERRALTPRKRESSLFDARFTTKPRCRVHSEHSMRIIRDSLRARRGTYKSSGIRGDETPKTKLALDQPLILRVTDPQDQTIFEVEAFLQPSVFDVTKLPTYFEDDEIYFTWMYMAGELYSDRDEEYEINFLRQLARLD